MICFFDADITLKLAACDLLPQVLSVLGITKNDVYVFREEAYNAYTYNREVTASYPLEARKRALRFLNEVHRIETAIDEEEQLYMAEVEDIDAGEQVIFGATRFLSDDFRLLTADKKALRALTYANGCGAIYQRLQGRVLCLERLVLFLIGSIGFETVRDRSLPCIAFDTAFSEPFQAGLQTDQADAERILQRRIAVLQSKTRGMLFL